MAFYDFSDRQTVIFTGLAQVRYSVSEVFTIELVDEVVQDDGDTTHEVEAATPHDSDEFVIAVVDEN